MGSRCRLRRPGAALPATGTAASTPTAVLLDAILATAPDADFRIVLSDGARAIYRRGGPARRFDPSLKRSVDVDIGNTSWRFVIEPSTQLVRSSFVLSTTVAIVGSLMAVLLGTVTFLTQAARARAAMAERAQRELEAEVAERRRAEAALQRAGEELETRVRERTASLSAANQRLEEEAAERERTQMALQFVVRALDHRVKNTLATVQAVADQTVASTSLPEFGSAFQGRIRALARIHTALAEAQWNGLDLSTLVELTVSPCCTPRERLRVPNVSDRLPPNVVRVLGMALHELATNATKYGALSNSTGRVAIDARFEGDGNDRRLSLAWEESGGPLVAPPGRRGFGSALIEEALSYELGGSATSDFRPSGIRWRIDIPVGDPEGGIRAN